MRTVPTLAESARLWGRVAALSFGGPAAQISVMHRLLVDEAAWVEDAQFLPALNFCMLLPGPEAQQLATYLGWLLNGSRGGLIAGGLFIAPGAAAIMALSMIYLAFGQVGLVTGAFFGLKAAVLPVVAHAVWQMGRKSLRGTGPKAMAGAAFLALFAFNVPFPLIILAAGLLGLIAGRSAAPIPATVTGPVPTAWTTARTALLWLALWLGPVALLLAALGRGSIFTEIAVFFTTLALVTFGGAYAILAWVAQEAVTHYHWLTQAQMLDGLGLAETTPGPLIMVLQFIGFMAAAKAPGDLPPMLAGVLGGLLATWVTFTPCFLWILTLAPYMERLRGIRALASALALISAAVVGVITNLALWFALHTLFAVSRPVAGLGGVLAFDLPVPASLQGWCLALSLAAALLLWHFRYTVPVVLGLSVLGGMALHLSGLVS